MAVTNAFRNAVSAGNVMGIHIMMKDSLLVDPTFAEFDEMSRLAAVSGLYDQHDGRELKSDKSEWNDDYMDKLMVQVVGNFSPERLDHLKEVVRYLRPVDPARANTAPPDGKPPGGKRSGLDTPGEEPGRSYQEQKRYDQRHGSYRGAKIGVGAAAGAIAGGVIAVCVASAAAVPIGAATGAVVGGVAVAVATQGGLR
ncbi:MAG: hypothetical protein LBK56_04640 [Gracilibacteraceae bacterium]|jgi:hypothetical protein|nr:hypothetical protein [Gracilibacteraceae bacterium]